MAIKRRFRDNRWCFQCKMTTEHKREPGSDTFECQRYEHKLHGQQAPTLPSDTPTQERHKHARQ